MLTHWKRRLQELVVPDQVANYMFVDYLRRHCKKHKSALAFSKKSFEQIASFSKVTVPFPLKQCTHIHIQKLAGPLHTEVSQDKQLSALAVTTFKNILSAVLNDVHAQCSLTTG